MNDLIGIDENGGKIIKGDEIKLKNEDGELINCEVLETDMDEDEMEITFLHPDGEKFTHSLGVEDD